MNEQDFVKMIDERLNAMMQYPRMFGRPSELELGVHLLLGLRAEVLGKGGQSFRELRTKFCLANNLRSKFAFCDRSKDDSIFMNTLSKYIEFCKGT